MPASSTWRCCSSFGLTGRIAAPLLFYIAPPMSKPKLTKDDFCHTAKKLKCDVAAIKAVDQVESRGEGFYPNGFPTILFERHKFRAFTHGRYNKTHPHLSGPQGGYGAAGENQRKKFSEAFNLDPEAAMMSCSWGRYQVMGFNWDDLGYDSIHEFVDRMKISEGEHLEAFARFVQANGLADELRRLDWKGFARGYNGPKYKENQYDTKMAAAYKKFKAQNINCNGDEPQHFADLSDTEIDDVLEIPENSSAADTQEHAKEASQSVGFTTSVEEKPADPLPDTPVIQQVAETITIGGDAPIVPPDFVPENMTVSAPPPTGFIGKLKAQIGALLVFVGGGAGLKEYFNVTFSPEIVEILKILLPVVFGLGFIGVLVWFVTEKVVGFKTMQMKAEFRTDPNRHNVVVIPGEEPTKWYQFWK